ncbi:MAG: YbaB/EbfC family nucleoid-associated protein [Arachnia sp.]
MDALLAQAQQMQADMMKAQEELAAKRFQGSAGGGLVTATLNGAGELVNLEISAEACDPEDTETLSALVIAAVRNAKNQADQGAQAAMPQLPEGFGL